MNANACWKGVQWWQVINSISLHQPSIFLVERGLLNHLTHVAFFFHQLLSLLIFWVFLFFFRGRYWSRVQGLGLRTQDSYPPWPAQEHHQPAGSMHAWKAIDGNHGICPSWQLALFSSIKEGHLRTRLDQDNKWSAERVHFSWSGDGWLSS